MTKQNYEDNKKSWTTKERRTRATKTTNKRRIRTTMTTRKTIFKPQRKRNRQFKRNYRTIRKTKITRERDKQEKH